MKNSSFKEIMKEFSGDNVLKLSAALAYYTIFSLPSMLMVVIAVSAMFFGKEAVQGQLFVQINGFVGPDIAKQLQDMIGHISLMHDTFLSTIIGLVLLFLSAIGVFSEIQDSINIIWGLKIKPGRGFIALVFNRLFSFLMLLFLSGLLVIALIINTVLGAFFQHLQNVLPVTNINYLFIADYILMGGIITLLAAFIYKVLPDAKVKWKDVWRGAIVAAILFMAGKFLLGFFLKNNATVSAYGAASAVIAILLWIYYSAILLFIGAEITQVHAKSRGRSIEPSKYAVWKDDIVIEKSSNLEKAS